MENKYQVWDLVEMIVPDSIMAGAKYDFTTTMIWTFRENNIVKISAVYGGWCYQIIDYTWKNRWAHECWFHRLHTDGPVLFLN